MTFLAAALLMTTARADWNVVEIGGRDYVSLNEVAEFYGLGKPEPIGRKAFGASGNGRSLRVKLDSRDAIVNGARTWLAFDVKERGGAPYLSRVDVVHTLEPAFRPDKVEGASPVKTIVLDAGHGGHDRGARSSYGYEKEYTLDVVQRLRKKLEKAGFNVQLTRSSDRFIELPSRPGIARKYKNSIFVSIHFNSADWNRAANGIEVYAISARGTPPTGQKGVQARDNEKEPGHALERTNAVLAASVLHSILGGMDFYDRGLKRSRFAVLRYATVPAILIECGFLTNAAEAKRIESAAWRDELADAIARGIVEYAKYASGKGAPRTVTAYGGKPTTEFVPEN